MMVADFIVNLMTAVVIPPVSSGATRWALHSSRGVFYCGWTASALVGVTGLTIRHEWAWAVVAAANTLLAVYLWWRRGRRRKRAPRAYGAKSRALITTLTRRARERARPRRVLRPQPSPG